MYDSLVFSLLTELYNLNTLGHSTGRSWFEAAFATLVVLIHSLRLHVLHCRNICFIMGCRPQSHGRYSLAYGIIFLKSKNILHSETLLAPRVSEKRIVDHHFVPHCLNAQDAKPRSGFCLGPGTGTQGRQTHMHACTCTRAHTHTGPGDIQPLGGPSTGRPRDCRS